jgi:hypothetical protein
MKWVGNDLGHPNQTSLYIFQKEKVNGSKEQTTGA